MCGCCRCMPFLATAPDPAAGCTHTRATDCRVTPLNRSTRHSSHPPWLAAAACPVAEAGWAVTVTCPLPHSLSAANTTTPTGQGEQNKFPTLVHCPVAQVQIHGQALLKSTHLHPGPTRHPGCPTTRGLSSSVQGHLL